MKSKHLLLILFVSFIKITSAQCNFAVELKDSQSNGWAGSSLDLIVNGNLVYDDLSISNGEESEVFNFTVNNNDDIEVVWNPGSVGQDETSYSILDNTGQTLITKTATDLQSNEINVICATCPLPQNIQLEYANDPLEEARFSFDIPSSLQLNSWSYDWVIMPQGQSPDVSSAIENGTINFNFYSELKQEITTSVNTSNFSNFDFYIRTNCEDLSLSQWSSNISFCFNCGQSNPLKPPYFENFFANYDTELGYTEGDGGSLASGPSVTGQGNWTTDFWINGGVGPGNESFKINMDGSDDVSWLILPTFDLSDADYLISYELAVTDHNASVTESDMGSDDAIYLVYKTSGSGSWNILDTYDNSDNLSFVNNGLEEIDLSAISSDNVQLAFVAFENESDPEDYDFFIDDIRLEENSCQLVFDNLNVDQITYNSVDISWDASPDEVNGYNWYLLNDNENPLFATPVQTGTTTAGTTQVSINALTSQTDYDFYVKTNCSTDQSQFSPVLNFRTGCGVYSAPFTESFEPNSDTEECWTIIDANNDNELWNLDYISNPNQGVESAKIGGFFIDDYDDWLISPQFNITGSEKLSFAVSSSSSNNPSYLEVLLSTTGNDPADFTNVLLPSTTIDNSNYITKTIDLSGYSGDVYIAWYVNNIYDTYKMYLDDITLIDCSAAFLPYQEDFESGSLSPCWTLQFPTLDIVSVTNASCDSNSGYYLQIDGGFHTTETQKIDVSGESSVDVSWDLHNSCSSSMVFQESLSVDYWDGNAWQNIVTYNDFSNFDNWTAEKYTVTSGLTDDFKLRFEKLGGGSDKAIDNIEVVSTPPCQQAPSVTATPFIDAVDLTWNSISDANNGYEWVVMASGDTADVSNSISNGTVNFGTNTVNVTNLNQNTSYDAYVRAICGSNIIGDWSNVASFATLTPPPPNDDVCNAISLNINQASVGDAYTLEGATTQNNEPAPFNTDGIDGSVWFSFVAPDFGNVKVELVGGGSLSAFDAEISAYSAGVCSDFSTFTNQQSGFGPISASNLNLYGLTQGETYYVQVDRKSFASPGTFGMEVKDLTYTYNTANGYLPSDPNGQNLQDYFLIIQDGTATINNTTTFLQTIVRPNAVLDIDQDFTSSVLFQSDASGFAQLDDTNGANIITPPNSSVSVEHFIPVQSNDTRAFRFLTSPLNSFNSIYDNWQESGNSPAGFGTHITGNNDGTNGVDQTNTGNPSMFTFDNTFIGDQVNAWNAVTNTKIKDLQAGEAYLIFIRGDRNFNLNASPGDPDFEPNSDVTLRSRGFLLTGDHSPTLSDQAGYFSLIGNPYQAIVDMSVVLNNNSSNLNTNYYWVWDPNLNPSATNGKGAYVAVDLGSGNNSTPGGGASSSDANQFVMPGQSFFVQTANNGAADITFTEASKDVNQPSTDVFSVNNQAYINFKLYNTIDLNNQGYESDALQIEFSDQFSNAANLEDASKLSNPNENIARLNNGNHLAIEKRKMPVDQESLQLFVSGYTDDNYTFLITNSNLPEGTEAFLVDQYTGSQTLLLGGSNQIVFSVDSNIPESVANDRFSIHFEIDTLGVDDIDHLANFKVFPNPVISDEITVQSSEMSGNDVRIKMYNMIGQKVFETDGSFKSNGEMKLKISEYQAGVYFLEVINDKKTLKEKLIFK